MEAYRVEKWERPDAPDEKALLREMESDGYTVYQWSDRPGSVYERHCHGADQSHWIISGELELTVDWLGTVILRPGDRDFMPAGTYHSARVTSEEPVIYLIGEK